MKIVLLYGGQSAEHDISIMTAQSIIKHINYQKHTLLPVYITQANQWIKGPAIDQAPEADLPLRFNSELDTNDPEHGDLVSPCQVFNGEEVIAFPALHGPHGEDGKIQGLFESLNVPYVGAGVLASAAGMDKIISKQLFQQAQIPQVPFTSLTHFEWDQERAKSLTRIEGELVYPIFVKPANLGSSVGISCANDREELIQAIELAFNYDRRVIVEQGVEAREVEVAVLGNDAIETSVAGEVVKSKSFYNYEEKYINNTVELAITADLPGEIMDKIRAYAAKAYAAIDSSGLTRVDFFVTHNMDIYINEVNTMPGFTQWSMYPSLWEATGIPYDQLLERLIRLGLERFETYKGLKNEQWSDESISHQWDCQSRWGPGLWLKVRPWLDYIGSL